MKNTHNTILNYQGYAICCRSFQSNIPNSISTTPWFIFPTPMPITEKSKSLLLLCGLYRFWWAEWLTIKWLRSSPLARKWCMKLMSWWIRRIICWKTTLSWKFIICKSSRNQNTKPLSKEYWNPYNKTKHLLHKLHLKQTGFSRQVIPNLGKSSKTFW